MTGVYESTQNVFLLLIVVRWFHGSPVEKSLVASAAQSGLLLAPLVLFALRVARMSVARGASVLLWLAAFAMVGASLSESSQQFVLFATAAVMSFAAATPLFTTVYAHNYSPTTRGRDFAESNAIRVGCSVLSALGAGWFLSGNIGGYYYLLWLVALGLAASAILAARLPGHTLITEARPLLACFRYLKTDRVLRETTVAWMLLGFGVLMMVPLRVEYLAHERHGLVMSEAEIAILLSIVPNVARLISGPLWGRIFDVVDFFTLRIILNCTFLISTVGFFATDSWLALLISAVILGVGTSGGDLAWNLWVTKFAPLDRVSDYMAVHVFFTGVRGVIAPPVGFFLLQHFSLQQLSLLSAALIGVSMLVLARLRR
jgi:MFS family permease